ncbi:hypothetical protein QZH41_015626 [Actinostola sp. cb2023]|nr:hypothetical protein QZH41_015626 [Actinostola sp. cb2023]
MKCIEVIIKYIVLAIDCGSHYTSRTGSFSSPGYPSNYSSNLYCVWTISVHGRDPEIELTFSDFDLPGKVLGKCRDYVSIYYGLKQQEDNSHGQYCGTSIPSVVNVKGDSARIEFVSDMDGVTGSGFVLAFSATVSKNTITSSQATAGIVAAIFCGVVFVGIATMRCIMVGQCQQCQQCHHELQPQQRECIGTNETFSNYVMDCPPSYRTGMLLF